MYKFIKLRDENNYHDITTIEMTVDTDTLPDLLDAFSDFLKASGYSFKGELVIHEEEDNSDYLHDESSIEEVQPNLEKEI